MEKTKKLIKKHYIALVFAILLLVIIIFGPEELNPNTKILWPILLVILFAGSFIKEKYWKIIDVVGTILIAILLVMDWQYYYKTNINDFYFILVVDFIILGLIITPKIKKSN